MCEVVERFGYLDRVVEGSIAILILDNENGEEVDANKLPVGIADGTWVRTEWEKGELIVVEVDKKAQRKAEERIRTLSEDIKKTNSGSRFKRRE